MTVCSVSDPEVAVVSLEEIGVDPSHNPRTTFNPEELRALETSVEATDGLVSCLTVEKAAEGEPFAYTVIDGERRYRALIAIGVKQAPVLILKTRNAKLAATAANQARVPLNPIEEANGIKALAELEGLKTNKQIADRIGALREKVSPQYIAGRLRLLKLPENVQPYIASGLVPLDAEPNLRNAAKASPALAECACKLVESEAIESRDLVGSFGWVIDRIYASDLEGKPLMIDMDRSQFLGDLITDEDALAGLVERYGKVTGETGIVPLIRFESEEVDAARAAGCLIEFPKGEDWGGEKILTHYLTDAGLAADLAARVVERIEREAAQAVAEDEDPAEVVAKQARSEERKEARKASEAAHTDNTAIGRALIGSRGAKNRKENKAAWVDAIAAVILGNNEDLAAAGLGLAFEQLQTVEHKTVKATAEQQKKVAYAPSETCRDYLWERIQEARTADQKLELLAEALIAAVAVDETAVPRSRRVFYSLSAGEQVKEILADQIKAIRPRRRRKKTA